MTRIYRLCPYCAGEVPLASTLCSHCGRDIQADYLPAERPTALQKVRHALPAILAGGLLVLQLGLAATRHPLTRTLWRLARGEKRPQPNAGQARAGSRVRIRTRWTVEGPKGQRRKGRRESVIESI